MLALCLPDLKKLFSQICFGKNGQRLFVFINEKELESLGVAYATSLLKKIKQQPEECLVKDVFIIPVFCLLSLTVVGILKILLELGRNKNNEKSPKCKCKHNVHL